MKTPIDFLRKHLENKVTKGAEATEHFITKMKKNPADALSWSQQVFQVAAQAEVAGICLDYLHGESADKLMSAAKLSVLREEANRRVLMGAKYPPMSTSATSNLMDAYKVAAWAEILEQIIGYEEVK